MDVLGRSSPGRAQSNKITRAQIIFLQKRLDFMIEQEIILSEPYFQDKSIF
jgi:hypothetical protein